MTTLRRWTSSLVASFDWMISQVENHEALVNAAIKEVQESRARAQVQLKKVKQDGQAMRKRLVELAQEADLWKGRAISSAASDEQKALECLKRSTQREKELRALEEQEREHARLEKQLYQDLLLIDERLKNLKQQRNLMRTRQSRAEALKALQHDDSRIICEIDDIFERWENKVAEYEVQGSCAEESRDEFETQFSSVEEQNELRAALQSLLQSNDEKKSL